MSVRIAVRIYVVLLHFGWEPTVRDHRERLCKAGSPNTLHSLSFSLDHSGRVNCPRDSSYYSAAPLEKVPDEASAPGNTADLGFPDEVIEQLGRIPWDFNGSGREIILG